MIHAIDAVAIVYFVYQCMYHIYHDHNERERVFKNEKSELDQLVPLLQFLLYALYFFTLKSKVLHNTSIQAETSQSRLLLVYYIRNKFHFLRFTSVKTTFDRVQNETPEGFHVHFASDPLWFTRQHQKIKFCLYNVFFIRVNQNFDEISYNVLIELVKHIHSDTVSMTS